MARKITHHEVPHFFLIELIQPLRVKELEIMPKTKVEDIMRMRTSTIIKES